MAITIDTNVAQANIDAKEFSEEEKDRVVRACMACVAIGGGKYTPQMRQDVLDILEHRKTADQVIEEIKQRHGVK